MNLPTLRECHEVLEKIANFDTSRWFGKQCHICSWDIDKAWSTDGRAFGDVHAPDCPFRWAAQAISRITPKAIKRDEKRREALEILWGVIKETNISLGVAVGREFQDALFLLRAMDDQARGESG